MSGQRKQAPQPRSEGRREDPLRPGVHSSLPRGFGLDPAPAGASAPRVEVLTSERRGRGRDIVRGVLVVLFLAAGAAKLAGSEALAARFAEWGYPAWMMRAVGVVEVAGALLLLSRRLVTGAGLLVLVMLGAIGTHVTAGEWLAVLAPVAVLVLIVVLLHLAGKEAERSVRIVNPGR